MKEVESLSSTKIDIYKSKRRLNTTKLKKNNELNEIEYKRFNSCTNLINFAPRITPKKSFCKPSLLILNPDDNFQKKHSEEIGINKLLFENDLEDNPLELSFDSSKDDDNRKINKEINNKNGEMKEKLLLYTKNNNNVENNIESNFDENICNKYDSGEYLTILDILSMNHKRKNTNMFV
jgi:hypothetical protein